MSREIPEYSRFVATLLVHGTSGVEMKLLEWAGPTRPNSERAETNNSCLWAGLIHKMTHTVGCLSFRSYSTSGRSPKIGNCSGFLLTGRPHKHRHKYALGTSLRIFKIELSND